MLHVLFFASGIAGLVYEVLWVRQFGNVFGNTVYSASLVSAVYMCGLGLGSWRAGIWADRRVAAAAKDGTSPARTLLGAYGAAEIGIAVFGLVLAVLLPRLGGLSSSVSSYTRGASGWHELSFGAQAVRYVVATLLVAPPTFLMGATLTLLVRNAVAAPRDVSHAAVHVGVLYGVNTAGAALGALATDTFLVPRLGVHSTQLVAVAINVVVGVGALALSRKGSAKATSVAASPSASARPGPSDAQARRTLQAACAALALSGFAALGMEIVWFRFISATLGSYRYVFSLILTVILVGIWLGAVLAGFLHRRFGRALEIFVAAQALVAVTALGLMATFRLPDGSPYVTAAKSALLVVALPSLLMGFSFPLVNGHVQDAIDKVGRRAGAMYLANTIGSVVGSLTAGLVMAPLLGSESSFAIFAACAAVAPLPLVLVAPLPRPRGLSAVVATSVLASIVAVGVWSTLPPRFVLKRFVKFLAAESRVVAMSEGSNELVTVFENPGDGRALMTNGHSMSANSIPSQRYMRAFSHLPLLLTDHPERALVICFGVGNTLHATSLHPSLSRFELADLSRNVLEHAKYFRATNHDVLGDPRLQVFIQDGRQHLRAQAPGSYDLVTLEPPPIVFAGISALYSREFYEIVKSRLKPNGYVTQWLPAHDVPPEIALAMVRAFVDVFPSSVMLSGQSSNFILMGTPSPSLTFDLDRLEAGLKANPAVAEDLKRVRLGTLTEIIGTFVADAETMRRATDGVAPITDDRAQMEYVYGHETELPKGLLVATGGVKGFCPKCFPGGAGGAPDPRVAQLPQYMDVLATMYATPRFMKNVQPFFIDTTGKAETIVAFDYLRMTIPLQKGNVPNANIGNVDARAHFYQAYRLAAQGALGDAAREYEKGLALDPNDLEARYNLAAIYASIGREGDAADLAEKILEADPSHAKARKIVCALRGKGCSAP